MGIRAGGGAGNSTRWRVRYPEPTRSFPLRRSFNIFAAATLMITALLGNVAASKKKQAPAPAEKKPVPTTTGSAKTESKAGKFNVPIPIGHDAKDIVIPYFNAEGTMEMSFKMELAKRLDADHLQMGNLKVETFNALGESEMLIDLPVSVLDLNTRIITSKDPVTIRRADFEITGETMEFNTQTRLGRFAGNVRMLIYNRARLSTPEEKASE